MQVVDANGNMYGDDNLEINDINGKPKTTGGGGSSSLTVGTTPIASGTVGRVLFEGTGNVLQEDSALFWDNTNKRLGVGATPDTSTRLDVRAQGALITDVAFRVRNSADTANILTVNGKGQVWSNGTGAIATNTAFGEFTLNALTTATGNTAFGYNSLKTNLIGAGNTAFGNGALQLSTGGSNTSVGFTAGQFNAGGNFNTYLGYAAGQNGTTAIQSVFIGSSAGQNSNGSQVICIGLSAGLTAGNGTIAIGYLSGAGTGSHNISMGQSAGIGMTTGSGNIHIGYRTVGSGITTGNYNTLIGGNSVVGAVSNNVAISDGQGNIAIRKDANNFVGVGYTGIATLGAKLDVRAQGALSTDLAFRVRNSADTANVLTVNGDGTQNWFDPANNTLSSIKSGIYNLIQWGNNNFGNVAVGYSTSNMITPTLQYCTLLGTFTSVLASGGTRIGYAGTVGVGGDYGIAIGYGTNVKGNSTIHIGRRTGGNSMSGLNSIHLGKTPSGNDIAPSNVFMTHFDSENASTLARGNGSFGLLGKGAYILADGTGIYGTDTFMGNGGNTLVVRNHASIPSTNIVDTFQQYSADIVAGNAAPHFRTENGNVIKIYRETTAVAAAAFVSNTSLIANDSATFGGYTMGQVVAALKAQGLLA